MNHFKTFLTGNAPKNNRISNFIVLNYEDNFAQLNQQDQLNFLKKYFSDPVITGGSEIDEATLSKEKKQACIYYKEVEVAKRVADRKSVTISQFKFEVKLGKPTIPVRRAILIDGNNVGITYEN